MVFSVLSNVQYNLIYNPRHARSFNHNFNNILWMLYQYCKLRFQCENDKEY